LPAVRYYPHFLARSLGEYRVVRMKRGRRRGKGIRYGEARRRGKGDDKSHKWQKGMHSEEKPLYVS